ncbi:TonB family protein [Emticicia oligotrophica DSM 17448]|uniref:TonB family protein n=1 Tax=Emticicia oligotrophica (strain DSM 17448 / CIP 109782 / MTCC 6937 / GPTSA100-15) TaxID=929562 RepID=A0ABN4APH7_EMTOG|nr:energy transducer TonB [Emticicia oligotrophica]AFK04262.1 TonB family protein [Emticicia oligotrophica DSM 17448]
MKSHTHGEASIATLVPSTLDDIVFEQRNKDYGAYEIRTNYSQNLNRALFIGVGCFGLMLLTNFIFARQKDKTEDIVTVDLNAQRLPDEPLPALEKPKEEEPPKPVEQVKSIAFLVPEVVEETDNEIPPPDYNSMENAIISNKTQDGVETDEIAAAPPTEIKTTEKAIIELPEEDNTAFLTVEVQPSFIGGNSEMYKFLSKNLKYPSAAQRANIQGKVFLSFIVEKDGSITDIETMKGIGFGCDEEAIRVVKLMPKWIAGKQNGRNVRVKFTIPVFFKLDD